MTNTIAIVLGALIVLGLGLDQVYLGGEYTLFLARKFAELLEWMAFWR